MSAFKKLAVTAVEGFNRQWPTIATVLGGGLLAYGGYLFGKEFPNYKKDIEEKEKAKGQKLTVKEKIPVAAKRFAAPVSAVTGGTLFLVAATCENKKRIAVGTTACAASEVATKMLDDRIKAAKEVVGEEKAKEIEEKAKEIREKEIKKEEEAKETETFRALPQDQVPKGTMWCYDALFNSQPFLTDRETLRAVENDFTSLLQDKGEGAEITLNEVFERIGHDLVGAGEALGWVYDGERRHRKVSLGIERGVVDGACALIIKPNVTVIDPEFFGIRRYSY